MQRLSKVSACRRMLSSHDAASRENRVANQASRCSAFWPAQHGTDRANRQQAQRAVECCASKANDWPPQCQIGAPHGVGTLSVQSVRQATAVGTCWEVTRAQRWLSNVASQGHARGAVSNWSTSTRATRSRHVRRVASQGASRPNPSVNLTRYGRRRKAGPRHMVHHRVPALRRLPTRSGYLER